MHKIKMLREDLMAELEGFADRPVNEKNLEFIDKLSHAIKCIDTVCAMESYGEDSRGSYGYSGRSYQGGGNSGRMYRDDYSYGNSGARRGYSNLGRYSRDEAKDRLVNEMEGMMNEVSPEAQHAIQRAISALNME